MNLTRERIRQVETRGLLKLRAMTEDEPTARRCRTTSAEGLRGRRRAGPASHAAPGRDLSLPLQARSGFGTRHPSRAGGACMVRRALRLGLRQVRAGALRPAARRPGRRAPVHRWDAARPGGGRRPGEERRRVHRGPRDPGRPGEDPPPAGPRRDPLPARPRRRRGGRRRPGHPAHRPGGGEPLPVPRGGRGRQGLRRVRRGDRHRRPDHGPQRRQELGPRGRGGGPGRLRARGGRGRGQRRALREPPASTS